MSTMEQDQRHDFSQIQLDANDERCGEVFIKSSLMLVFHCSLCASNFESFDNFLNHLSTQHYEDIQNVIEIDSETEKSDNETLFEEYSSNKLCQEQESIDDDHFDGDCVIDEFDDDCDDDDDDDVDDGNDGDAFNGVLLKVEVNSKKNFEKIEEIYLEDANSLERSNCENTTDVFDLGQTKDEVQMKEQTLWTQYLKKEAFSTKAIRKKPLRKKYAISLNCEECGKEFETNRKLKRHYITHSDERKHKCRLCGFAFKERPNLDAHMRRHTGIKTIGCSFCSKKFFTRSEAKNHEGVHTGERPFICPTCGLGFTNAARLKMHCKRHNSDPGYKCNYCEKGFYGKAELKDHMLVHTKEKAFVCITCEARFPRNKSLIRHAKLHENITK